MELVFPIASFHPSKLTGTCHGDQEIWNDSRLPNLNEIERPNAFCLETPIDLSRPAGKTRTPQLFRVSIRTSDYEGPDSDGFNLSGTKVGVALKLPFRDPMCQCHLRSAVCLLQMARQGGACAYFRINFHFADGIQKDFRNDGPQIFRNNFRGARPRIRIFPDLVSHAAFGGFRGEWSFEFFRHFREVEGTFILFFSGRTVFPKSWVLTTRRERLIKIGDLEPRLVRVRPQSCQDRNISSLISFCFQSAP